MAVKLNLDEVEQLKSKVFLAAKDNKPDVIRDCLASLHPDVVKDVLHHYSSHEGFEMTPLVIAAFKGHLDVVDLLVKDLNVDVTQEVLWMSNTHNALTCAVSEGHLNIVKILLMKGCSMTATGPDEITSACLASYGRHLGVLKYLVENGADINDHSSEWGTTCLMVACKVGNREMVEYLLSAGANPNVHDDSGRTALHWAAERNYSEITALLFNHGADLSLDKAGHSPLIKAARHCASESVHTILQSTDVSQVEGIDALELLGASQATRKFNEAVRHLSQAMEERYKNPDAVLLKPHSPLPTLSNLQESQTLEELHVRQADQHLLRLEGLDILIRILGPEKYNTLKNCREYFDQLRIRGRHREATTLLLHGVRQGLRGFTSEIDYCILQFAVNFADMLKKGMNGFFSDVEKVMELILDGVGKNFNLIPYFTFARGWLCYVLIGLNVAQDQEEGRRLLSLGKRFIQFDSGSPVLCVAVDSPFVGFEGLGKVDSLPYDLLISFLLYCGADVQASFCSKNTPLHRLALWSQEREPSDLFSRLLKTLLQAGALVGIENQDGKTPLDLASPWLATELQELYPVSLKSLAATAVVKYEIPYASEIPMDLKEFH